MLPIGTVVKSLAGHDSNSFYVVLNIQDDFAFIADGKLRTISKPKKKRFKHLQKTNTVLSQSNLGTDKQIRNALHCFNYGDK